MLKKAIVFTILALFVTGCVSGPDQYFKRSANNKIFDTKGFKGGKRQPLYNRKYIAQAKKNILNGEYDDEEMDDEEEDPSRENIEMYKAMIEDELHHSSKNRRKKSRLKTNNSVYPSIVEANDKISADDHSTNLELKEEITQIKTMLNDAKKELASYRCPTAKELEQGQANEMPAPKKTTTPSEARNTPKKTQPQKATSKPKKLENKPQQQTSYPKNQSQSEEYIPDYSSDTMIIEPVQSI